MNIYLDIDDVIFDWGAAYANRFHTNIPKYWTNSNAKMKKLSLLSKDKDFWLNLPIKNIPNFIPNGFVSARGIPKAWTKESLQIHKIPGRNTVYQVSWGQSKIEVLKSLNCDIFIDDKVETFKECHKNNIMCLLMDANHNKKFKTKYRIFNLDITNILQISQS
jgi:uncharacterized HAD superfamily protein